MTATSDLIERGQFVVQVVASWSGIDAHHPIRKKPRFLNLSER